MLHTRGTVKIKTQFHIQPLFPPKDCCLSDNVEIYSTARQARDDNTIRRLRIHAECLRLKTHTQNM